MTNTTSTIVAKHKHLPRLVQFLLLVVLSFAAISSEASLLINEVAYKGSGPDRCDGEDWIELLNTKEEEGGQDAVDLTGYVLHDDKGKDDEDARTFGADDAFSIAPGEYLVLCKDVDFEFGIGSDDTVTLLDGSGSPLGTVSLPGTGADDETYAYLEGGYKYTTTPTPGEANVYTEPIPLEKKLEAQNEAGNAFFRVGDKEDESIFSGVVDVDISMDDESRAMIADHPAWEEWVPFTGLSVSATQGDATDDDGSVVSGGGKIRTKGQSTLLITACTGSPNVPFQIEFDAPFLGMETVYLRNHMGDFSYMRDHASHVMLKAFGLPYLRTRPARVFVNGEYVGFYTLMEAPTQGYVMQRSFGAFDPASTALFKAKTGMGDCPYTDPNQLGSALLSETPDPYYFERGDHRMDAPILGLEQCYDYFFGEIMKDQSDMVKGYLEYDNKCGLAMVEMGRVDRDYGAKSIEETMVSFLDSKFYNTSVTDLTDNIDTDQWLKNLASYAVMLNVDSPLTIINNFYLATTEGGEGDWKIVQYDHNNIASRGAASLLCSSGCGYRLVYWPILRPTCGSVESHKIVGRVLNSEENIQKYLDYVTEMVEILEETSVLEDLYSYSHEIKEYVLEDPLGWVYSTIESYEESELGTEIDGYNTEISPFLRVMKARLVEVRKQLDAIGEGSLPLDGVYDPRGVCPDWRDSSSEDYIAGSTLEESCPVPGCDLANLCYSDNACTADGEMLFAECGAATPFCDSCFPYSGCGLGRTELSKLFVEGDQCGKELADCSFGAECFNHKGGICAFDGEILAEECAEAALNCKSCFPRSRCGTQSGSDDFVSSEVTSDDDGSAAFVVSEDCGDVATCAPAGPCFDHKLGLCALDGSITDSSCQLTLPFCKPCFPNSRCGSLDVATTAAPETANENGEEEVEDAASLSGANGPSAIVSWIPALAVIALSWFWMVV